jgi:hypothetical protein
MSSFFLTFFIEFASSGQVLAKWKDGKLYFAKDLKLDKKKFNQMLIDFFNLEN